MYIHILKYSLALSCHTSIKFFFKYTQSNIWMSAFKELFNSCTKCLNLLLTTLAKYKNFIRFSRMLILGEFFSSWVEDKSIYIFARSSVDNMYVCMYWNISSSAFKSCTRSTPGTSASCYSRNRLLVCFISPFVSGTETYAMLNCPLPSVAVSLSCSCLHSACSWYEWRRLVQTVIIAEWRPELVLNSLVSRVERRQHSCTLAVWIWNYHSPPFSDIHSATIIITNLVPSRTDKVYIHRDKNNSLLLHV